MALNVRRMLNINGTNYAQKLEDNEEKTGKLENYNI